VSWGCCLKNRSYRISDIKLFRYSDHCAEKLAGVTALVEMDLQQLIETQMESLFLVCFLVTDYSDPVGGGLYSGRSPGRSLGDRGTWGRRKH
jgi:hypothetical protein